MKNKEQNLRIIRYIGAMFVLVMAWFLVNIYVFRASSEGVYVPIDPLATHDNGKKFSGSEACAECHEDLYKTHMETAHFKSSSIANLETVKGSFKKHKNEFHLSDSIVFKMNVKNGGLYQDVHMNSNNTPIKTARFDVVIGSGTKGQSYLKWKDSSLYQLQVSYFTPTNSWINSPGYASSHLAPERPIFERCLECHMTYAKSTKTLYKRNSYDRSQMVYGIDCERCHGPAWDHVNFHKKHPLDTIGRQIVKHSNLSRQQQLDACALCHSGLRTKVSKSIFSFMVGDSLNQYSRADYSENDLKDLDVHGNQYGLLSASKCFKKSVTMNCTTCHNPHQNQRNDHITFNNICQSCHTTENEKHVPCSASKIIKKDSGNNCIQCHMPLIPSKGMKIATSKDTLKAVQVRTHFIGIYTDL